MSYEKVTQAKKLIIGTKQTIKALKSGDVQTLVVASDAEHRVTEKVKYVARQSKVSILEVDSMRKLGKASGIDVPATVVSIMQ